MRILETAYSGKNIAGGEIHLLYLIKELIKNDHIVTVICPDSGAFSKMLEDSGCKVKIIPFKHSYDIIAFFRIWFFILKNKFDIIHTHGLMLNTLIRTAAVFAGKNKIISTVHLIQKLYKLEELSFLMKLKFVLFKILDNFLAKRTRKIIAVSNAVANDLIVQGIDYRKIEVIHNGIDLELFKPIEKNRILEIKKEYNIPENAKIIGIAGRIAPLKGHITFIKAAKLLQEKYNNIHIIIAGEDISGGNFKCEVEKKIKELDVKNVIFTGFVKNIKEMASIFDIWCIPSWHEPFGLVVTEAMALKIPVVASNSGGIPEIIRNNETGILVEPKNEIKFYKACEKIFSNNEFKDKIVENAYIRVHDKFSINIMAAKTELLFY